MPKPVAVNGSGTVSLRNGASYANFRHLCLQHTTNSLHLTHYYAYLLTLHEEVQVRTISSSTINPRLFHHPLLPRRLRLINFPRMPRRIIIRVPLGSQITPPRRRASFAAFLLEFPIRGGTAGAVSGYLPRRHLWVFGSVVEGSAAVVAWTRRYAAHFWRILD